MLNLSDSLDWISSTVPDLVALEEALRCRICRDLMKAPLITACCHTFCSLCIRRCLSEKQQCPLCRQPEQEYRLRKNTSLEEAIEAFERIRPILITLTRHSSPSNTLSNPLKNHQTDNSVSTIVECPVCHQSTDFNQIHTHLDICLNEKNNLSIQARASPSKTIIHTYSKLPKLNYALLSESKLRSELKSLGLKIFGDKAMLQRRHSEWINLWNSNIDSKTPVSKRVLLEKLDAWDQVQSKTPSIKHVLEDSWIQTYKTDFEKLIQNAQQSKKRKVDTSQKKGSPKS